MTTWAIVPIKAPEHCKTRLRDALSDAARTSLVAAMLRHVVETAASAVDHVTVLGPSRHDLRPETPLLEDHGGGLNAELAAATRAASEQGVHRLLILAADLPALTRADVEALASADGVAIAPDRAGTGTNALSLQVPAARDFRFQFGPSSLEQHRAEAARLGLPAHLIQTATLGLDIDIASDLSDLPPAFRAPA